MNKEQNIKNNNENSEKKENQDTQEGNIDKGMEKALQSVMIRSENTELKDIVQGYDFNEGVNYSKMFEMYKNMGFQSSSLGKGIEIINQMIKWKLSNEQINSDESDYYQLKEIRESTRCTIFLGYTSNLVSSGLREVIRYLCVYLILLFLILI